MRKLYVAIVLALVAQSAVAQSFDFRKTKWGMSSADVKKTESCKMISEAPRKIVYECSLAENETKLIYAFSVSDKLTRSKYFITPDYINMIFYIRDFKMYEELMTQKYGKPIVVSPKAINKGQIPEEEWAGYLSAGELQVEVKWDLPDTEIFMTLSKMGEKPAIQIDYISKTLYQQDKKDRASAALKEL